MQESNGKRPTLSVAPGLIGAVLWTQAGTLSVLMVIDAIRTGTWSQAPLGLICWAVSLAYAHRGWHRVRVAQDRAIMEGVGQILARAAEKGDLMEYFKGLRR